MTTVWGVRILLSYKQFEDYVLDTRAESTYVSKQWKFVMLQNVRSNVDGWNLLREELKEAILDTHKPIQDKFFKGIGNRLQFEDSCIAESVMLHFAKMDAPALPIHDSFIMHHGFSTYGELEEAMRRAFYERFNKDIGVSRDLIVQHKSNIPIDKDGFVSLEIDDILNEEIVIIYG